MFDEPDGQRPADDSGVVVGDDGVIVPTDGAVVGDAAVGQDTSVPPTDAPERDQDGDGYLGKDDCDDGDPLVNPGAIELPGNGKDDDCNGVPDDARVSCDDDVPMTTNDPLALARAIGLCRRADADATGKSKTWGVIAAHVATIDGVGMPLARQYGVHKQWGTLPPPHGSALLALSTGSARLPGQTDFLKPLDLTAGATNTPNEGTPPAGFPWQRTGCPQPTSTKAFDSITLKLKIRVPTNAKGFSFDTDLFSSEFIEYACSAYDDALAVFVKTAAPLGITTRANNVLLDTTGALVGSTSPYLEVCTPGTTSTGSLTFACALGRGQLSQTGFEDSAEPKEHGSTSWLRTTVPVVPGEVIEVTFALWNTSDHLLQSTVLFDRFVWTQNAVAKVTTARP